MTYYIITFHIPFNIEFSVSCRSSAERLTDMNIMHILVQIYSITESLSEHEL